MHPSAHAQMGLSIQRYMEKGRRYRVLDIGSGISPNQTTTHRTLLADYDVDYVGTDIRTGENIDVVMEKPYKLPLRSRSVDVVLSGQVFEHVPFFWASLLEVARVMKPRAYFFLTVPSRGHVHTDIDCWRFYPDGLRSMAAWARLNLIEAFTDFPPSIPGRRRTRHDFAKIDSENYYWGDSVGVFRKPANYPTARAAVLRASVNLWANRIGDLALIPQPAPKKGRKDVLNLRD